MKTRVISALVGIVLFIGVVFFAPVEVAILAISLLCGVACYELLGNTGALKKTGLLGVCCLAALCVPTVSLYTQLWLPGLFLFTLVVFGFAITHPEKVRFEQISQAYLGAIIMPYLLASAMRILHLHGALALLLPFIAAWCSDTMALVFGLLFGKHKLIPKVSPKKTVEGAFGGLVGGALGMVIFGAIASQFFKAEPQYLLLICAGVVGSVAGQVGDLSLSLIKRNVGIKDYGNIMPGHGGVLDRFDSVLFTAPLFEILLHFAKIL